MKYKFLITWVSGFSTTHSAKNLKVATKWAKEYLEGAFEIKQLSKYPTLD